MIKNAFHIIVVLICFQPIANGQFIVSNNSGITLNSSAVIVINNMNVEKSGNIFDNSSSKIIFSGNNNTHISGSNISFNTIEISKSQNVILDNPVTISNSIIFTNGYIQSSNTKELYFTDNATYSSASNNSHINGPVIKEGNDDFIFPIGNGIAYAPIKISDLTGSETFRAEYKKNNPNNDGYLNTSLGSGLNNISQNEYWLLSKTGVEEAYVTLYWNSNRSGSISDINDLVIAHWNTTPTPNIWEKIDNEAAIGNTSSGSIKSSQRLQHFSPFTLGSTTTDNPLPINLTQFYAIQENETIIINWTTESELNNDEFILQKSTDGINFYTISNITGAGNSRNKITYSEIDIYPNVINYYRLLQKDFDGVTTCSEIITIIPKFKKEVFIQFNSTQIICKNLIPGNYYTIQISNESGKTLFKTEFLANAESEILPYNFGSGIWITSIFKNNVILDSKKLVFK